MTCTIAVSLEPLVAEPPRRLREREVDLHLGAAVAEAARAFAHRRRDLARRAAARRAASASRSRSRPARRSRFAVRVRTPTARPLCTSTRSTSTPVSHVPPWSRISRTSASASLAPPPRGIGIPPSCTATAITCVMNPDAAASGPRPVCSTHGASSPCARSDANVCSSQSRLVCSSSPVNAAKPLRPSRRTAFAPNARPAGDHSSVPSTPNARSAFGKKRSSTPGHSGPSSLRVPVGVCAAGTRPRRPGTRSPSAARCSGTRARAPPARRRARACAAPPTQSGCHALKTSCRKPGSVISAVRIAPPSQSLRSSTQTRQPPRASSAAQASELTRCRR